MGVGQSSDVIGNRPFALMLVEIGLGSDVGGNRPSSDADGNKPRL